LTWTGLCVALATVVQLAVVAMNMEGVSGIWSAELGLIIWMLLQSGISRLLKEDRVLLAIEVFYSAALIAGIIYFAVTLPFVSTACHLGATVVGMVFCHSLKHKFVKNANKDEEDH
jgi:hypothetical protein